MPLGGCHSLRWRSGTKLEQNEHPLRLLFFLVFFLELVPEVLSALLGHLWEALLEHGTPLAAIGFYIGISFVLISWSTLGLGLFSGYRVGRSLDLKANLRAVIYSLVGGTYFGSSIGQVATTIVIKQPKSEPLLLVILGDLISTSFLSIVFTVFTALSLAYLRSPKHPLGQYPRGMNQEEGLEPELKRQKMRLLFVIVFILGLVDTGVFYGWSMIYIPKFLVANGELPSMTRMLYWQIISSAISLTITGLVLLGGYWIGQKIDLEGTLRASILSTLGGAYFGGWVGAVPLVLTIIQPESLWLTVFLSILLASSLVLHLFFRIFTALSLAHLRSP
ncbi:MAG: hypothetical protein ACFFCW_14190 [Candidatus Hodarchaeota archaeon]